MQTIFFISIFTLTLPFCNAQSFKGIPAGNERIESSNKAFEKEVLALVNKERKKTGKKTTDMEKRISFCSPLSCAGYGC